MLTPEQRIILAHQNQQELSKKLSKLVDEYMKPDVEISPQAIMSELDTMKLKLFAFVMKLADGRYDKIMAKLEADEDKKKE